MHKKRLHHLDLVTKPNFYFKSIRLVAKIHEVSFPRYCCCLRLVLFLHAFGDVNGVHRHMRLCLQSNAQILSTIEVERATVILAGTSNRLNAF